MTDKVTMAAVWEELDETERKVIAEMMGVEMGQLALAKISNVLKGIAYRYHDKPEARDHYLLEKQRAQMEYEIHKLKQEYQMARAQAMQRPEPQMIPNKKWHDYY